MFAVSVNMGFNAANACVTNLLRIGIISIVGMLATATAFTFGPRTPVPFVSLVIAVNLEAISVELMNSTNLRNPDGFNPHTWDTVVLLGVQYACHALAGVALVLGIVAIIRLRGSSCSDKAQEA